MPQQKRHTWYGFHPEKGKKGFSTEEAAKAWEEDKEQAPVEEPEEDEEPDAG